MLSSVTSLTYGIFYLATALTLALWLYSLHSSSTGRRQWWAWFLGSAFWLGLTLFLTTRGWYEVVPSKPPTAAPLLVGPPLLLLLYLLFSDSGKQLLQSLSPVLLLSISLVRIPVELCLHRLYQEGVVPHEMTYAGRNFDILAGLTAPVVAYLVFYREQWPRSVAKAWWLISLALLLNIVVHAVLSLPSSIQAVGFDQPNLAVTHIPFVWLPAFIVPVVLLSHAALYRQLWRS